jgi:hypothetical protein
MSQFRLMVIGYGHLWDAMPTMALKHGLRREVNVTIVKITWRKLRARHSPATRPKNAVSCHSGATVRRVQVVSRLSVAGKKDKKTSSR